MRELQPVNQNVLLSLVKEGTEYKTASGIIIPDSAKQKQNIAKVVGISNNIENAEVSVGENVLYKDFTGTEVEFDGAKYLLIQYSDILAKIVETEEI